MSYGFYFHRILMKQRLYFILLPMFIFLRINATPNVAMEHYTVNNGLASNVVFCSLKDSDGFMWFGTLYGLCSFDGINFKTYTNHDRYFYSDNPPRNIQAIIEDKNGFLWIQTADEKVYLFDRKKECFQSLYDDVKKHAGDAGTLKMQRANNGDMLLLTKDRKLLCAASVQGRSVEIRLLHDLSSFAGKSDSVSSRNILEETNEYISWIGTDNRIHSYRKGKDLEHKPSNAILAEAKIHTSDILTCAFDGETHLWVGNNTGDIYCIDPQTGRVDKYKLPDINRSVQILLVSNDKKTLYAYTKEQNELYEYDIKSNLWQKNVIGLNSETVLHAFLDKYNKIWFEEKKRGLFYYDPQSKTGKSFPFSQEKSVIEMKVEDAGEKGLFILTPTGEMLKFERESLLMIHLNQKVSFSDDSHNQPFFYNQAFDPDGMLWLSSSSGIYCLHFFPEQFRLLDWQTLERVSYWEKEKMEPQVTTLFQAKDGSIWAGTRQSVYLLNKNKTWREILMPAGRPINNLRHIMEDSNGNFWLSTKNEGLIKATPDIQSPYGFRFVQYMSNSETLSSLGSNRVSFTFQDSKGRIWVGVPEKGLNLLQEIAGEVSFNHKYNGFKQYPPYGLYTDLCGMAEDNDGRIWVGTTDGLMSFDVNFDIPEDLVFETYREEKPLSVIGNDNIAMLYKDSDLRIWIGLFGGGLSELTGYDKTERKPLFKLYDLRNGLRHDAILSVVEDNSKNVWFATGSGVLQFDKQTGRFNKYGKYDGFPEVTIEKGSALRTSAGEIWLGCKEGILAFSPDKWEYRKQNRKTYIIDFKIPGKEDYPVMDVSIKYADKIELKHNQSTFSVEFMALDYSSRRGDEVLYRYRLKGYEKEWHFNGNNRIASYTEVPSGTYKLFVQSMDESGSEWLSGSELTIRILPGWWATWQAYMLYIILIISSLAVLSKPVIRMIKAKIDLYVKRQLSDLKIRFFTNLSNEIRIPLALIKNPIRELKEENNLSTKGMHYIELMEKNTDQMLQLLNQILDFGKMQRDTIRLNISPVNLNKMMEAFYKEFRMLSEESETAYSFQLMDEDILLWADKEKLGIGIRNVISNAFKFTPSGKNITVSMAISNDKKKCYIQIESSGGRVQEDELMPKAFEHVSQANYSWNPYHQGTGIGFLLSEELINLHHGSIVIKNQEDHSILFTIELRLGKKHFNSSKVNFVDVKEYDEPESFLSLLSDDKRKRQKKIKKKSIPHESVSDFFEDSSSVILLLEENKDLANLFKRELEGEYNVAIVTDVGEGLKKINHYHPDIIVINQALSQISSMDLLKRIRKDFRISHIPVIVLAAEKDEESRIEFLHMGVVAYLTGSIEKEYLIDQMKHLQERNRQFRERIWNLTDIKEPGNYMQCLTTKDIRLLEKLVQVMSENLSDSSFDFNINDLIPNTKWDYSLFQKKIEGLTGFTPMKLIKEVRLNKSTELLKTTNMSLSEIASTLGFKDLEDYERCFFSKYNQTPIRYRNS
ncbi:Sensor histidine kinase TmoS [termite gut metagenome]|uniref:Sensor histidine kinase TmoS n=1 Tax=termite gut metagenome TaxID=433724 RepID=A0A5J4S241_9ZZZZ